MHSFIHTERAKAVGCTEVVQTVATSIARASSSSQLLSYHMIHVNLVPVLCLSKHVFRCEHIHCFSVIQHKILWVLVVSSMLCTDVDKNKSAIFVSF